MKFFHVHPNDSRWLRSWLRNNLIGFVAIVGIIAIFRFGTANSLPHRFDHLAFQQIAFPSPVAIANPTAVLPEGWRRTAHGWEHVSTWRPMATPQAAIAAGKKSSNWIDQILGRIQKISPVMFALIQITAIAAIINITRKEPASSEEPAR